jgi:hypothetical protein
VKIITLNLQAPTAPSEAPRSTKTGAFTEAFKTVKPTPPPDDPMVAIEKARLDELLGRGPIAPVARHVGTAYADGPFEPRQWQRWKNELDGYDTVGSLSECSLASPEAYDRRKRLETAQRARIALIYRLLCRGFIVSDVASMADAEVGEVLAIAEKYEIGI